MDLDEDCSNAEQVAAADPAEHLIMTQFEIIKPSNKSFPDQMSRLISGTRVQNNDTQLTHKDILQSLTSQSQWTF